MAIDAAQLQAALSLFLDEMEGEIEDRHEVYLRLTMLLNQMRAMNMPIPDDLAEMERDMSQEFTEEAADAEPSKEG
jgi:hypothetical protein